MVVSGARGIIAITVGVIAVTRPGITLLVLLTLFALLLTGRRRRDPHCCFKDDSRRSSLQTAADRGGVDISARSGDSLLACLNTSYAHSTHRFLGIGEKRL